MRSFRFPALLVLAATLFAASTNAQAPAPKVFTEKDREFALKYANDTRDDYVKQLTGLSDKQLNFRSAEGRWTIGEIAEHIIVVENALRGMVDGGMKSPVPDCKDSFRIQDVGVILGITNRQQKFTAPEPVRPNGRWKTIPDLLTNFGTTRQTTIDYMTNMKEDMRSHFASMPLGRLDAFQGYLFMIGHSERHLAQLKEVKADAKFPAK
ncbi:MAG TPA: DinB family protein [Pyrinomonadaceae bacterium]|nr:DinB family protein [Pyrinomonadaceae bacterium]